MCPDFVKDEKPGEAYCHPYGGLMGSIGLRRPVQAVPLCFFPVELLSHRQSFEAPAGIRPEGLLIFD